VLKNAELRRQAGLISNLLSRTQAATGGDIELQSHWARYLCVLAAGFLENAIFETYSAVIRGGANPAVASFASSRLEKISNPKSGKFTEIAGTFKAEWKKDLERFLDDDGRRDAIDSVMTNRHQIAHGEYSGITIARLKPFFEKSVTVVEFLEKQCGV
jgi:hypothetical protein